MITKDDLVVAVFDDVRHAEQAIADLYKEGFALDKMDMVTRSQGETSATPNFAAQKHAADGAVVGAATGAGVGAVAGAAAAAAAVILIPGFGIALAAGLLAGAVGGTGAGGHWRFDHRPLHRSGNARRGRPLLRPGRQGRRAHRRPRSNAESTSRRPSDFAASRRPRPTHGAGRLAAY